MSNKPKRAKRIYPYFPTKAEMLHYDEVHRALNEAATYKMVHGKVENVGPRHQGSKKLSTLYANNHR